MRIVLVSQLIATLVVLAIVSSTNGKPSINTRELLEDMLLNELKDVNGEKTARGNTGKLDGRDLTTTGEVSGPDGLPTPDDLPTQDDESAPGDLHTSNDDSKPRHGGKDIFDKLNEIDEKIKLFIEKNNEQIMGMDDAGFHATFDALKKVHDAIVQLLSAMDTFEEEGQSMDEQVTIFREFLDLVEVFKTVGQSGTDDGQQGGPSGNGPSGNGPSGNGPSGNGPSGNGPSGNGPSGNGPSGNGPSGNGPSGNGPSGNGPPGPSKRELNNLLSMLRKFQKK